MAAGQQPQIENNIAPIWNIVFIFPYVFFVPAK